MFCWKHVSSFCNAKATHIFSTKNIRILCIESAKTVNEMTLNELVKLTTLWQLGPDCWNHFPWGYEVYFRNVDWQCRRPLIHTVSSFAEQTLYGFFLCLLIKKQRLNEGSVYIEIYFWGFLLNVYHINESWPRRFEIDSFWIFRMLDKLFFDEID